MTASPPETSLEDSTGASGRAWFLRGLAAVISFPAFILAGAFIGFAGLARDSGLSFVEAVVTTATVWALPSQVVLIGAMTGGASVLGAGIAVAFSAVRLMPMVVAWVPVVRDAGTPRWKLALLSHFVAVTSWVFAMSRLPDIPRPARLSFFAGFATSLTVINICVTAVSYQMVGHLPELLGAALFFLMPIYFLCSLWAAARQLVDRLALLTGLVLGPVFFLAAPGFDLLWTGLVGGTAAYLLGRWWEARCA